MTGINRKQKKTDRKVGFFRILVPRGRLGLCWFGLVFIGFHSRLKFSLLTILLTFHSVGCSGASSASRSVTHCSIISHSSRETGNFAASQVDGTKT